MAAEKDSASKKGMIFGIMELALFGVSLFLVIPSVPSDDSYSPNNYVHIWGAWFLFSLSRIIAFFCKKRSLILVVAESILFLIFLNVLALRFTIR